MRGEGAFGNLERKEGQREERVGVGKKREVERWGEEKIRRRDRDMDMESVALCPKRERHKGRNHEERAMRCSGNVSEERHDTKIRKGKWEGITQITESPSPLTDSRNSTLDNNILFTLMLNIQSRLTPTK